MDIDRQGISPATSITHQHITAIIYTLLKLDTRRDSICILDVGCGNGLLLTHMIGALTLLRPDLRFDAFGLDVNDACQQDDGYIETTRRHLQETWPAVDWNERIKMISSCDEWPFQEESFDFITSNQVMEHVMDHNFVFRNIQRCLRPGGVSINLFPVREVLWEDHALMPLVHRVKDEKARARLILLFAKVGFRGAYHREMQRRGWGSLKEFAQIFARVLQTDTNYLTAKQLVDKAEHAGLQISFTYTKDFFKAKMLSYAGKRPYSYRNSTFLDPVGFFIGKYLSSVTVLLRRAE
jgi:SAM-dependent methyltransferase